MEYEQEYVFNKPNRKTIKIDKADLRRKRRQQYSVHGDHGTKSNTAHTYNEARKAKYRFETFEQTDFDIFFDKSFCQKIMKICPESDCFVVKKLARKLKTILENDLTLNRYVEFNRSCWDDNGEWDIKKYNHDYYRIILYESSDHGYCYGYWSYSNKVYFELVCDKN